MRQLIYFYYIEEVVDRRVEAMQELEYMVVCKANKAYIPHHQADDLAQELRILLWQSLPTYNPHKSSLKTWANRVLENRLKNIYKAECRTQKRKDYLAISLDNLAELQND